MSTKNTDSQDYTFQNSCDDCLPSWYLVIRIVLPLLNVLASIFLLHRHIDLSASQKDILKQCGILASIAAGIIGLIVGAAFYVWHECEIWRIF